ncbi:MAG: CHAT domain-containing protein [Acidobacteria bacterium]|nr:MAG: CHAT domain-containing protein [Acidobacteriota bacterium]
MTRGGGAAVVLAVALLVSNATPPGSSRAAVPETGDAARAQLAVGHAARAVALFERALERSPEDPDLLAGLAAALILRARQTGSLRDVVLALDAAETARARHGDHRAASIVSEQAAAELLSAEGCPDEQPRWTDLLAAIGSSPSPDGAARAVESLVRHWPARSRDLLIDVLLAGGDGPPEVAAWSSARRRFAAERIAAVLREIAGGPPLAALAGELDERGRPRAPALRDALAAWRQGQDAHRRGDFEAAAAAFRAAAERARDAGSALAPIARYRLAVAVYLRQDFTRARALLEGLLAETDTPTGDRMLAADVLRMQGLLESSAGRLAAARLPLERAARSYAAMGERDFASYTRAMLAETGQRLGDSENAWRHRVLALRESACGGNPFRRRMMILEASLAATLDEAPRAAAVLADAALAVEGPAPPGGLAEVLLQRAAARARIGELDGASEDLLRAASDVAAVPDVATRERLEIEIAAARLKVAAAAGERRLPDGARDAVAWFERKGRRLRLAELLLARARIEMRRNRLRRAERDLERAIGEFERSREELDDTRLRIAYRELSSSLFDEMVRLQAILRNRPGKALGFAERGRAHELARGRGPAAAAVRVIPDPGRWARRLPRDATLVYFVTLPRRLLAWRLARGAVSFRAVDVTSRELARRVVALRDALAGNDENPLLRESASLAELLFGPWRTGIAGSRVLLVSPDGPLHALPFAVLQGAAGRGFLIEDVAPAIVPSAALVLGSARIAHDCPAVTPRALVIGDPAFDRARYPLLARLEGAAREARTVAAAWPESRLLAGEQATRGAFLEHAGAFGVIHFAGHAIADPVDPARSRLLLAGDDELAAGEVAEARLVRGAAIVLAACSTAGGRITRGEGTLALARPFLAAGAGAVIASLWELPDDDAGSLLVPFHRELAAGMPAPLALQRAQQRMLSAANGERTPVRAWSAFEVWLGRCGLAGLDDRARPGERTRR